MDFFMSQHGSPPSSASIDPAADTFAQEIGRRFSLPAGQSLLTARLSPAAPAPAPSISTPQAHLGNLSLRSKPPSPVHSPLANINARITTVVPATLLPVLNTPSVLVLDIRPHATFAQSRLPHALSLSVPSTLLKRPAFPLDRLADMLPSSSCRRHFSAWKSASRILVYDTDSIAIPEGSNIRGLLRKFENEGFHGDIAWLKGGFTGVWREARILVDNGPPSPESSEEEDTDAGYLRTKRLPSSAFQQVSTTSATARPSMRPLPIHRTVAPAPTSTRPVAANPFYDNIRQNRELEHGITERIPLRLPPSVVARRDDLPYDWLKEVVDKADAEEGTEALAMQFYMIELREQRRLMGVMDHHSREAGTSQERVSFPYSITAGVEKGSKNRYTNIWPFEHARVRLNACNLDDGSDYINASYVQPLGTNRRYIATQGPLPTTFTDFWTLCWEQNISIIVMLTKEVEGSTVKCGSYWTHSSYGPLRLDLVSSSSSSSVPDPAPLSSGFDFGLSSGPELNPTIRRTFRLSHTGHPAQPARTVTQLQYLAWPDFDVPEDPHGLLDLMRQVDVLRGEEAGAGADAGPVLLHCSAGIGRTGGFIMADAALDGIRREMRERRAGKQDPRVSASLAPMDMDPSPDAEADEPPKPDQWRDPVPRHIRHVHNDSSGTDSDDFRARSPSNTGTASSSSTGPRRPALRPSAIPIDVDLRKRTPPRMSIPMPDPAPAASAAEALSRFRSALASGSGSGSRPARTGESSASVSTTHLPSIFSLSLPAHTPQQGQPPWSSSFPTSVESSRSPSPAKDAEPPQTTAFDYTNPRRYGDEEVELLSSFAEPVKKMLEDMREQRMSLCQSLRQYVFVHRAIVEGALGIVDEERERERERERVETSPSKGKRGPSPTELAGEDRKGGVRLTKRPSTKRRERSGGAVVL